MDPCSLLINCRPLQSFYAIKTSGHLFRAEAQAVVVWLIHFNLMLPGERSGIAVAAVVQGLGLGQEPAGRPAVLVLIPMALGRFVSRLAGETQTGRERHSE